MSSSRTCDTAGRFARILRTSPVVGAALLGAVVLGSCSGGGSPGGVQGTSGNFIVLRTEPPNNGKLFLNDPIRIDFSNQVDLSTANLNTISFNVFDANENALTEQPAGTFELARSPGDTTVGRRLEFVPRFPTNNEYTNGGFRPGRTYLVQLVGGERRRGNVLLDDAGRALSQPDTFQFQTADGTTPSELFRDTRGGGPRRVGFEVSGGITSAYLNKSGQNPVVIKLRFDQPLNPHSENVPVAVDIDPSTRSSGKKGRIFLQYDDPDLGTDQWIPARVVLAENRLTGSEVQLFPLGVLPNNATIEVIVENTLEDMSGESNTSDASYNREFATFDTLESFAPQFDALVENFEAADGLDFTAPFLEPVAEVNRGHIKANFDFEGSSTILDYQPSSQEVILNTDFTQITPKNGPPINVSGGVFQFRNVTIPSGVTVRGQGSNPMVWLVTGDFTVEGELRCDGGLGSRVDTLKAANFPTAGGQGVCGGGKGGRGSPNTSGQSSDGESGFGPGQIPGGGGQGGTLGLRAGCGRGSGGGGGSYSTEGDPYFKQKSDGGVGFIQQTGVGGFGCQGPSGVTTERTLPGGRAGPLAFTDVRKDNNFWGAGVNIEQQIRITGELTAPRAGTGGGGGGDLAGQLGNQNWISNNKGGGGGGGGGTLIIKCLGTISIGPSGVISADGGHGGGGEQAGGNNEGGGGAGGSGGMVVLMAGQKIRIEIHGETYAAGAPDAAGSAPAGTFNFAISADGGVGTQGSFGGVSWNGKYPPPSSGEKWDRNPAGAFGGLGIVQLMVPAGDNLKDGTNTALDDNIEIIRTDVGGPVALTGDEKERYIAWRGYPNAQGVWVDDSGEPTYNNDPATAGYPVWANTPWDPLKPTEVPGMDAEGDIRPAPLLLPAPFGHKSRVRTRWIDLGTGAVREPIVGGVTGPRSIAVDLTVTPPLQEGPRYEFSGTQTDSTTDFVGYVNYTQTGTGGIALDFPTIGAPHGVSSVLPSVTFQDQANGAYQVTLAGPTLGSIVDRYAQYQARLMRGSAVLSQHRILSHTAQVVFLANDQPLPASLSGLTLQIVAQFYDIRTNGAPGLGPTYTNAANKQSPIANIRFGFAFHADPGNPVAPRFPPRAGTFLYDGDDSDPLTPPVPLDLSDPTVQESLRAMGMRYIKWDVLFNTRFSETEANNTRTATTLSPASPRPELHFLLVPYRY